MAEGRARRTLGLLLTSTVLIGLSACGTTGPAAPDTEAGAGLGEITVFAAASLTAAFSELGATFEHANPGARVRLNFAGSSALVAQINQGSPADVLAAADTATLDALSAATAEDPVVFTTNRAQIIVEAGNPRSIASLEDLADPDLILVTCAPTVPCGRYAQQILDAAGVQAASRSLEENVTAVVTKVTLGEADAGIVYATDVIAAGEGVDGVEIPAALNLVAEYPILATAEAPNPAGAQAFISFVLSETGQEILASHGFISP